MVFYQGKEFASIDDQLRLIESQLAVESMPVFREGDAIVVPVPFPVGQEKDYIVDTIVRLWKRLSQCLEPLRIDTE